MSRIAVLEQAPDVRVPLLARVARYRFVVIRWNNSNYSYLLVIPLSFRFNRVNEFESCFHFMQLPILFSIASHFSSYLHVPCLPCISVCISLFPFLYVSSLSFLFGFRIFCRTRRAAPIRQTNAKSPERLAEEIKRERKKKKKGRGGVALRKTETGQTGRYVRLARARKAGLRMGRDKDRHADWSTDRSAQRSMENFNKWNKEEEEEEEQQQQQQQQQKEEEEFHRRVLKFDFSCVSSIIS